jgi:hypothetical protein
MSRFKRNPAISETTLGAETFLVDAEGREVYYLDAVSSGLWRLLREPTTLDSCLADFSTAFPDVSADRLREDLARALAELERGGLVFRLD